MDEELCSEIPQLQRQQTEPCSLDLQKEGNLCMAACPTYFWARVLLSFIQPSLCPVKLSVWLLQEDFGEDGVGARGVFLATQLCRNDAMFKAEVEAAGWRGGAKARDLCARPPRLQVSLCIRKNGFSRSFPSSSPCCVNGLEKIILVPGSDFCRK